MTTKELLALVGRWRATADGIVGNNPEPHFDADALRMAADELAPIATALCAEVEALKAENERAWTAANRANAKVRGWESTMVCTGLPLRLFPVDGWGPGGDGTVEIPQLTTEKLTSILDRLAAIDAAKEPK